MQKDILTVHTDGGSRGNPGPAACAFVLDYNGKIIKEGTKYLEVCTNNVAEYQGVIIAFEWMLSNKNKLPDGKIVFLLDSELVVKQLNGVYKIKKEELKLLNLKIKNNLIELGREIIFKNIPREQNKIADRLLNKTLDEHNTFSG